MSDETRRDRVRRLLIAPLQDRGMRFAKGTAPDQQRRFLDGLADDLGYMADDRLRALEEVLRSKGEGHKRCFWPQRVAILGWAEALHPRPIEELPAMASWLGSVEGPKAQGEGTLVPVFRFIERYKRPPVGDQDRRAIASRALAINSDVGLWRDRRDRGVARADELASLRAYDAIEARALALIEAGAARRAGRVAADAPGDGA